MVFIGLLDPARPRAIKPRVPDPQADRQINYHSDPMRISPLERPSISSMVGRRVYVSRFYGGDVAASEAA